jgi:hypothetical protein
MKRKNVAKILNFMITRDKFVNKDEDKYIYASLSQPPIKIIDKNNSDDELDFTVECPNCHRHINYGTEVFMVSGHIYCSGENCREEVCEKLEKK